MDDSTIRWHNLALIIFLGMLGAAILLPLDPLDKPRAWTDLFFVCFLVVVQVTMIKGLGWRLGAKPLNDWELDAFKKALLDHPDCMAAVMHWLTPDTVLRAADKRLLGRAIAKKNAKRKPQNLAERMKVLANLTAPTSDDRIDETRALASQTKAMTRGKSWDGAGWPARMVSALSSCETITGYTFPLAPRLGLIWCYHAIFSYFGLCAIVWMVQSWMASTPVNGNVMLPLDVMATFWFLLLTPLPIPIATMLHHKFAPISDEDIRVVGRAAPLQDMAAAAYMKALPENHEWTRSDIVVALDLANRHGATVDPGVSNPGDDHDQVAIDDDLPVWLEKPWRGGWAQRLLLPSKPIQDLGNDLSERPAMVTCLILVAVVALLTSVGWLVSRGTVSGLLSASIIGLMQVELLRLACYINVSAKLCDIGVSQTTLADTLAESIPDGGHIIAVWRRHPSGLRVADLKMLKKCSRHYQHNEVLDDEPNINSWYPHKADREKILQAIAWRSAGRHDEKAQQLAGSVGRPLDPGKLVGMMGRRAGNAFTAALDLYVYLWSPTRTAVVCGGLTVLVYAAMTGVTWAIGACLGARAGGWDIVFPFGMTGTLALAGGLAVLVGVAVFLVNRSIAPVGALDVFEREISRSIDAGPCLAYLGNLSPDRHWTFQDLFRALTMVLREETINIVVRQARRHAHDVGLIFSTQEATIGQCRAQSEQMDQGTQRVVEEVEAQAAPVRRF